jgi:hypothetical protein
MTSSDNFRFDHYRGDDGDHWQLNVAGGEVRVKDSESSTNSGGFFKEPIHMKRDLDLIRKLLLKIEEKPDAQNVMPAASLAFPNYSKEQVNYHLLLLYEAGYIDGVTRPVRDTLTVEPRRLTWNGHEFLDAARDEKKWNEGKKIMEKIGNFSFEVATKVLADLALKALREY